MKADIKLIEQAIRILQDTVKRVVDMRTSLGLVYIDIDRFSAINNLYGKENGDRVLETISRLVAKAIPSEFVMRFGADQFLICVKLNNGEDVNKFGQRLMRAIDHCAQPLLLHPGKCDGRGLPWSRHPRAGTGGRGVQSPGGGTRGPGGCAGYFYGNRSEAGAGVRSRRRGSSLAGRREQGKHLACAVPCKGALGGIFGL